MTEAINKQIRIPKAKIEEIVETALKISIQASTHAGLDLDMQDLFIETVRSVPINEELIPAGIVIYLFEMREAVIQKFSGYQHVVPWLMFPFFMEFKKIPQVAEQLNVAMSPFNNPQ